ncbi:hypothetical protein PU634_13130 [Oceanimonas pelagia]|uniref:Type 4 fimbrial biogenesis protein PilX N-terminal domain-containing protein n=1 Tax=Oceanimonas pelagia TaxID=3028314 RepID=A0AA50QBC8_9GAMM|nr:PilX N-terminal domain-containing pilus assembly protein [Oceanimonas pelagia]WMC10029.1 hypothetical protein PU634_13130 [Oceanimonas pelagia]
MTATNTQKGFATLTITLVLVSMLVAVSVFIGKVLVSDKRITLNEIEYRVALAAAEKGIADAMAQLKVNPAATSVSGSLNTSSSAATYQVTMTPNSPVDNVWQLLSVATLANGASTTVSVQVAERSILNPQLSGPAAPMVIAGNMPTNGNITIVGNPNGGGPGIPISVWSDKVVNLGGSAQTCGMQEYHSSAGCTKDNAYSYKAAGGVVVKGKDIIESDIGFPDDLVDYLFGISDGPKAWETLEKYATEVLTSCDALNGKAGFFIVEGASSCTLDPMGTKSAPVLLVLKDMELTVNGNGSFYGLLFAYDSNTSDGTNYKVKLNGNTKFYGAMISNYSEINLPNGNYDSVYDQDVMCAIAGCNSGSGGGGNPFSRLTTIPGSWKDW